MLCTAAVAVSRLLSLHDYSVHPPSSAVSKTDMAYKSS